MKVRIGIALALSLVSSPICAQATFGTIPAQTIMCNNTNSVSNLSACAPSSVFGYNNPLWLGADPTGSVDASSAITSALSTGSGVVITPGTYKLLSSNIAVPNDFTVEYLGTNITGGGSIGPPGMVGALANYVGHAKYMQTADPATSQALDFNALQIAPTGSTGNYEKFAGWDLLWSSDPSTISIQRDGVARGMYAFVTPGTGNTPHLFAFNALCGVPSGTDGGCAGGEIDVQNAGTDVSLLSSFLAKPGLAIDCIGTVNCTAALFISAQSLGGLWHDGIVLQQNTILGNAFRVLATGSFTTDVFDIDHNGNVHAQQISAANYTASNTNSIVVSGNTTGNFPVFTASGSDTNVGIKFVSQGTGSFIFALGGNSQLSVGSNIVLGSGSLLPTGATTGFPQIPSMTGHPTGSTGTSGAASLVYDQTNNQLCINAGAGWQCVNM